VNDEKKTLNRRAFLLKSAVGVVGVATAGTVFTLIPRSASAATMSMPMSMPMDTPQDVTGTGTQKPAVTGGVVDMDGEYYKAVRKPAKANPVVQMTPKQINEFERGLACPCPCTLDVFTCRTTDFSCGNSPAVHRDVQQLVAGGYSGKEIMAAMIGVYGDEILMAPPKSGINLVGWYAPFAALGTGAIVIAAMLRKWRGNAERAAVVAVNKGALTLPDVGATDDELARIRAALRDDGTN
jgi:cytochrome c-type biogenesis protein CcmH